MSALLKRLRDAIWPAPLASQPFMSKGFADELERILPGEVLIIVIRGREFAIVEREEFDLVMRRAGMCTKTRV